MTTIATDGKTVVADKRITSTSGVHYTSNDKIHRIGEWIVGASGDAFDCIEFLKWFRACEAGEKIPVPNLDSKFEGLAVHESGKIVEYGGKCQPMIVEEKFYAIGSGVGVALGALAAGADPKKAIEIACRFDRWTGNGITVLKHKKDKND